MSKTGKFLFWPGQVVATPGALVAFQSSGDLPFDFLIRHMTGDWGDLDAEDVKANEVAVAQELRILSAYHLQDGTKKNFTEVAPPLLTGSKHSITSVTPFCRMEDRLGNCISRIVSSDAQSRASSWHRING